MFDVLHEGNVFWESFGGVLHLEDLLPQIWLELLKVGVDQRVVSLPCKSPNQSSELGCKVLIIASVSQLTKVSLMCQGGVSIAKGLFQTSQQALQSIARRQMALNIEELEKPGVGCTSQLGSEEDDVAFLIVKSIRCQKYGIGGPQIGKPTVW